MLASFSFANPWFLLGLPLVWVLVWWQHRSRWQNQAVVWLGRPLPSFGVGGGRGILPLLRLLGLSLAVLALARPQTSLQRDNAFAEGIDIMIAMDVSHSMLARDFEPDRLVAAKEVAARFIQKRPYDRIGLVAFSGESFTQCPLTTDHKILTQLLMGLQCGLVENGTAIGMGLANAVRRLESSTAKSKIVILLTDGENNTGYISPEQAMQAAQNLGIKVYTIGVGTRGRAPTPISINPSTGGYMYALTEVDIDEALLEDIASRTQGQYFRATDMETFENIYDRIDELEKTKIEKTSFRQYREHFWYFVLLAFLVLLAEWLLSKTRYKTLVEG